MVFLLVLISNAWHFQAQAQSALSDRAVVSLLTVESGDEVYSVFGHTGIRFKDDFSNTDLVFNYGTFDFNQPYFILNFMRGRMNYQLAVEPFDSFLMQYRDIEKRGVIEQKLNLTIPQKRRMFAYILDNYKPENRFYRYDFFYDNCATRPRDLFEKVLGDSLHWRAIENPSTNNENTFRDMLHQKLWTSPYLREGIDIVLGSPIDRKPDKRQKMFLPESLSNSVGQAYNASIEDTLAASSMQNGQKWAKFVQTPDTLVAYKKSSIADFIPFTSTLLFIVPILLFLIFVGFKIKNGWSNTTPLGRWDGAIFLLLGLVGLLMCALWFGTDHKQTAWNYNLLFCWPSHLVVGVYLLRNKAPQWIRGYAQVFCISTLLFCVFSVFIQQMIPTQLSPTLMFSGFLYALRLVFVFLPQKQASETL
jgi:hypothetical protein